MLETQRRGGIGHKAAVPVPLDQLEGSPEFPRPDLQLRFALDPMYGDKEASGVRLVSLRAHDAIVS